MSHEMVTCPFDDMATLTENYYPWAKDAFDLWKWNQTTKLGEKWAISVPAARLLHKFKDNGCLTESELQATIAPLLQATLQVPLVHAYVLAIFAKKDLPCSAPVLTDICNLLLKKWHASIVAAGEMVGTIAAQSVGEPTTQM